MTDFDFRGTYEHADTALSEIRSVVGSGHASYAVSFDGKPDRSTIEVSGWARGQLADQMNLMFMPSQEGNSRVSSMLGGILIKVSDDGFGFSLPTR